MQPNLVAWLQPRAKMQGPVCPFVKSDNQLAELAEAAGVAWKSNGLRKSFISYRLAITQNITQVADEAGNSPAKILSNYRKPISKSVAERWFNLLPPASAVIQLPLFK